MEGSSSSRKLTMKLVTRILDRKVAKWTPIPCTSGIIRGKEVKIDVCILMQYITWPTLGYIIICFYFLPMIPLYTFLILVWCMSSQFILGSIQTCNIIYLFIVMIEVIFLVGQNPMDANNWRPTAPSGEPVIDTGDWRIQLQPDSRKRIVDKM